MKLEKLSSVQIEFALIQRARGYSAAKIVQAVQAEFPGVHRYAACTYEGYFKSPEGQERLKEIKASVRAEALKRGFAQQGDRLDLMQEMVERLRERLRDYEERRAADLEAGVSPSVSVKEINDTSAELRQTLGLLQKEVDPLADSREAVAPAIAFFQQLQKHREREDEKAVEEIVQ